jgi:hypothetical protein
MDWDLLVAYQALAKEEEEEEEIVLGSYGGVEIVQARRTQRFRS